MLRIHELKTDLVHIFGLEIDIDLVFSRVKGFRVDEFPSNKVCNYVILPLDNLFI